MPSERVVTCSKQPGARTHLGIFAPSSKCVGVNSVSPESPFFGQIFPGDILVSINGVMATSASDAAKQLVDTASLSVRVLSPHDADIVFLPTSLELELVKDKKTGLLKVVAAYMRGASSTHDLESGMEGIRVGDLLLSIAARDGVMQSVTKPAAASQLLRDAQLGGEPVEARVVRDPEMAAAATRARTEEAHNAEASNYYAANPTHCVARTPWSQWAAPAASDSGRTSPTNSWESASEEAMDGASAPSAAGAAWRSMEQRQRRTHNKLAGAAPPAPHANNIIRRVAGQVHRLGEGDDDFGVVGGAYDAERFTATIETPRDEKARERMMLNVAF